jgi:hypothetical protein
VKSAILTRGQRRHPFDSPPFSRLAAILITTWHVGSDEIYHTDSLAESCQLPQTTGCELGYKEEVCAFYSTSSYSLTNFRMFEIL